MGALISVVGVLVLVLLGILGASTYPFAVLIPYFAVAVFILGLSLRILRWGLTPVPFRIPTTCGQQESLPWIKQSKIENPSSTWGVVVRMLLEVLTFRSLFRNTKTELREGPQLAHGSNKWLWLGGLVFHWSFLIIVLRHFRFFSKELPGAIKLMEGLDSFLQIGVPLLYMTDVALVAAVTYLFLRRVLDAKISYISLPADYFPLMLILGIAVTGIMMRYFTKVHIVGVKEYMMGLLTFKPAVPEGVGALFWVHLFLVSSLLLYFPFSKLVHMGGVFLSPTRNMANNNRKKRHKNPWNYKVKFTTYEEYEDDFRDKMIAAGLPVVKEPEPAEPAEAEKE